MAHRVFRPRMVHVDVRSTLVARCHLDDFAVIIIGDDNALRTQLGQKRCELCLQDRDALLECWSVRLPLVVLCAAHSFVAPRYSTAFAMTAPRLPTSDSIAERCPMGLLS